MDVLNTQTLTQSQVRTQDPGAAPLSKTCQENDAKTQETHFLIYYFLTSYFFLHM